MKLKLDEAGHVVVLENKPLYVHDDGKEVPFDAAATIQSLNRTLEESKKYKERAQTAETSLKAFEGIDDVEAARKALETVKNLDQGQLVTAGKVDEIKKAARMAAEEQVASVVKASTEQLKLLESERDKLRGDLSNERIGGAFKGSDFISKKVAVPVDMVQAMFGRQFGEDEQGKVVGIKADGTRYYSRANPGEVAKFDEALEIMIDAYSGKEMILKGTGSSGTGARQANGNGPGGRKTMSRAELAKLDPAAQMKAMNVDRIQITDD